jgi:hypothetical protein
MNDVNPIPLDDLEDRQHDARIELVSGSDREYRDSSSHRGIVITIRGLPIEQEETNEMGEPWSRGTGGLDDRLAWTADSISITKMQNVDHSDDYRPVRASRQAAATCGLARRRSVRTVTAASLEPLSSALNTSEKSRTPLMWTLE